MVNLRLVLACLTLAFVGLASMPVASATAVPLPGGITVGDRDGDGLPEAHVVVATPPCLCACPVVGAGVDVEAAGQEVYAIGVDGLCAYAVVGDVDPGAPSPLSPIVITPIVFCNSPVCATVSTSDVALAQPPSIFHCWTTTFDAQGDGSPEPWTECSTPTCGCNCPVVGAGVVVEATPIDEQVGAAAATSGCQTAYATTVGPADGGAPVTVWPIAGGGVVLA